MVHMTGNVKMFLLLTVVLLLTAPGWGEQEPSSPLTVFSTRRRSKVKSMFVTPFTRCDGNASTWCKHR